MEIASVRKSLVAVMQVIAIVASTHAKNVQDDVAKSANEIKPLKLGAVVPNSTLLGLDGKAVELTEILSGKPTVLIFYRGGWCPFCNAHLAELAKVEGRLRDLGFQVVAISPDTPTELSKTVEKGSLHYQLYSDPQAKATRQFGVAFRVDGQTFTMYKDRFGIDLERSSGEKHHILPVPSVFLVAKSGKVAYVYTNPDYKVRLKGTEIVAAAKRVAE